jgi:hypothetical protein
MRILVALVLLGAHAGADETLFLQSYSCYHARHRAPIADGEHDVATLVAALVQVDRHPILIPTPLLSRRGAVNFAGAAESYQQEDRLIVALRSLGLYRTRSALDFVESWAPDQPLLDTHAIRIAPPPDCSKEAPAPPWKLEGA